MQVSNINAQAMAITSNGNFMYTFDSVTPTTLYAFSINAIGTLNQIATYQISTLAISNASLRISANNQFLYITATNGSSLGFDVLQYRIETTGALIAIGTSEFPSHISPVSSAITPTNLYVLEIPAANTLKITVFSINQSDGTVSTSPSSAYTINNEQANTPSIFITSDNTKLFLVIDRHDRVCGFIINATDGSISTPIVTAVAGSPKLATGSNSNSVLYVMQNSANTIAQFTINSDASLTALSPATLSCGATPNNIQINGNYLYTYNASTISQFSIGSGGVLSPLASRDITINNAGNSFVFNSSYGFIATNVGIFNYSISSGGLTPVPAPTPNYSQSYVIKEFGYDGSADVNTIPDTQAGTTNLTSTEATLQYGFPALMSVPEGEGGLPPDRADINGAFALCTYFLSQLQQGVPFTFQQSVSTYLGGYGSGVVLWSPVNKKYYISQVANNTDASINTTSPNPTNWQPLYTLPVYDSNQLVVDATSVRFLSATVTNNNNQAIVQPTLPVYDSNQLVVDATSVRFLSATVTNNNNQAIVQPTLPVYDSNQLVADATSMKFVGATVTNSNNQAIVNVQGYSPQPLLISTGTVSGNGTLTFTAKLDRNNRVMYLYTFKQDNYGNDSFSVTVTASYILSLFGGSNIPSRFNTVALTNKALWDKGGQDQESAANFGPADANSVNCYGSGGNNDNWGGTWSWEWYY